jgi:hypothetical protein
MSIKSRTLVTLGKLGVVIACAIAFFLGLTGTVYLSLRSPDIRVPDIVGKDMVSAETALGGAGLNIRKRATRFSAGVQPNVVLDQTPRAGEVVKEGQTVAVVVSRAPQEGEAEAAAQKPAPTPKPEVASEDQGKPTNDNNNDNRSNKNKNQNSSKNKNANTNSNLDIANRNISNANIVNRSGIVSGNANFGVNLNNRAVNSAANRNVPTPNLNRRVPTNTPLPSNRTNGNLRNP